MRIEEQVLSREQMAHLNELGIDTSDASMYWSYENSCGDRYWVLLPYDKEYGYDKETIPTYTISDLINKLPKQLYDEKSKLVINTIGGKEFYVWYGEVPETIKKNSSLLNALYELLCWVSEKHKDLLASN